MGARVGVGGAGVGVLVGGLAALTAEGLPWLRASRNRKIPMKPVRTRIVLDIDFSSRVVFREWTARSGLSGGLKHYGPDRDHEAIEFGIQ
jgi:hypothetical protein